MVHRGVPIARRIHPGEGHALAVSGTGKQTIHQVPIGIGGCVRHKGRDLGWGRRHAAKIKGQAPDQGGPVGFGRWIHPMTLEFPADKTVDGAVPPIGFPMVHARSKGPECPVLLVNRTL